MTVKELIEKLSEFPQDLTVMNSGFMEIDSVYESVCTHDNYPYNKPDKQVIIIE